MSKPTLIADILRARLKALGVTRQIKEASVEHVWESLVGPEVAAHTHVIRSEAGRVFVAVDSAPWRQELMYQKQEILEKLNQALGEQGCRRIITDIMFTGP
jgi:predicted nucleic acid-binding Zn ribbon protein